jgi:hypothetical protein
MASPRELLLNGPPAKFTRTSVTVVRLLGIGPHYRSHDCSASLVSVQLKKRWRLNVFRVSSASFFRRKRDPMSDPKSQSTPRTAAVLHKHKAAMVIRQAEELAKTFKVDKEWEEDARRRERAKINKERSMSERVANRCQEVRSVPWLRALPAMASTIHDPSHPYVRTSMPRAGLKGAGRPHAVSCC